MNVVADALTAVIPAAGLGTRMVPATKEMPKEMLPIPARDDGMFIFKPFIQLVFENLYAGGVRTFVFVVGRGKRILQDHFIVDWSFHDLLKAKGKDVEARALARFYNMVENTTIIWVDQPSPKGLGDAVYRGLKAVKTERVVVHLGDVATYSPWGESVVPAFLRESLSRSECGNVIHVIEVEDPRNYGVVVPGEEWIETGNKLLPFMFPVKGVVEKPSTPPSNYAISGLYLFDTSDILGAIEKSMANPSTGEYELTDAIALIAREKRLCAGLSRPAIFIDIGRPSKYLEAIERLAGL